jgi:phosphoglycerol transferase
VLLGLQFSVFSYAAAYLGPDHFARDYVDPATVALQAGQRRNLVLIYAESLEASYGDATLFGQDLLAPLRELGGRSYPWYRPATGATWTMAGIVATQCGVPLKVYAERDLRPRAGGKTFLPGATCLGDLLRAQGYRNVFLGGVSLDFAGKGRFLRDHGYDEAWGWDEWQGAGAKKEDANAWGLWDSALFERATTTLDRLHAAGQPFNLTLLTLDTHNPNGLLSPACRRAGARDFEGIVACSARQIAAFVRHARDRGYLRDTTVVVIGDHLAVPNPVYETLLRSGRRGIFNLVAGENLPSANTGELMPFDWFPTLLELAGTRVAGDRLGLGYSAVGSAEAVPPPDRAQEWSLARVNGSPRYDRLWMPQEPAPEP